MDSFGLRQEQSELLKSVSALKHKLEIGENRIKELHNEEMQYLKEIPQYKIQAEDARIKAQEISERIKPLQKLVDDSEKEFRSIEELVAEGNKTLADLKVTQAKIIDDTKMMNEDIKQKNEKLRLREFNVGNSENLCNSRDIEYKERNFRLINDESALAYKQKEHQSNVEEFVNGVEQHQLMVEEHGKKVDALIQSKELHLQDEQLLVVKEQRVEKLIKENTDLKASLLLQSQKLNDEIKLTQAKQTYLDKSLADLKNQENVLKIKELRIEKLIRDNNLHKELKELEEQLK